MLPWGDSRFDLEANPYWTLAGHTGCRHLLCDNFNCLELIFKSIYFDFPKKEPLARKATIGDCCPENRLEDCPGHPQGAHRGGDSLDIYFFTNKKHNFTQSRPPGNILEPYELTIGDDLDPDGYDCIRIWALFKRIKQVFPDAGFMIDEGLIKLIQNKLKNFDPVEHNLFATEFRGKGDHIDQRIRFKHHLHTHVTLGKTIDWELETNWRTGKP